MIYLIIGNGRSGTCWLGETIRDSGVETTIEDPQSFDLCHKTMLERGWAHALADLYRTRGGVEDYCDKSHPNIWNVDALEFAFTHLGIRDQVRYIGIEREMLPCVMSHLKHDGCRTRLEQWDSGAVPWRYLGICRSNYKWYRNASTLQRAVMRWSAHTIEMRRLEHDFKRRLLVIQYEDMALRPGRVARDLGEFIGRLVPIAADPTPAKRTFELTVGERAEINEAQRIAQDTLWNA